MGFCVCGADDNQEDWQRWDDHPARKQWDVVKDLGAGAMSTVRRRGSRICVHLCAQEKEAHPPYPALLLLLCIRPNRCLVLAQVVLARNKQTGSMAALKVVFLESPAVADDPEHLTILQRCVPTHTWRPASASACSHPSAPLSWITACTAAAWGACVLRHTVCVGVQPACHGPKGPGYS